MMDYNHWAALGVLGEILPWEDNRVELADETDGHGIRVAKITFSMRDNDKKVARFGVEKTTEIMYAAGAEEVVEEPRDEEIEAIKRSEEVAYLGFMAAREAIEVGKSEPEVAAQTHAALLR